MLVEKCHKIFCNQFSSPLWCLISFWGLLVNGWTCFSTPYIFLTNMVSSDDLLSPVCDFQPTNSGKRAASVEVISLPHLTDSVVPLPLSHNHNITHSVPHARFTIVTVVDFISGIPHSFNSILSPMYNQYIVIF